MAHENQLQAVLSYSLLFSSYNVMSSVSVLLFMSLWHVELMDCHILRFQMGIKITIESFLIWTASYTALPHHNAGIVVH